MAVFTPNPNEIKAFIRSTADEQAALKNEAEKIAKLAEEVRNTVGLEDSDDLKAFCTYMDKAVEDLTKYSVLFEALSKWYSDVLNIITFPEMSVNDIIKERFGGSFK